MVDLAKIRKKAKRGGSATGGSRPSGTGGSGEGGLPQKEESVPAQTPAQRLEKFVDQAGRQRFAPQAAPSPAVDEVELLTFLLGSERYAIEIDRIAQIIAARPATPIPNAPPSVTGIISLRGSIVTLIDIRSKLRQPPREANRDARLIVIRDEGGLVGFEVDRVLRPAKVGRAAIESQPVVSEAEENEAIRGVIRREDALTIVLDLVKLLE